MNTLKKIALCSSVLLLLIGSTLSCTSGNEASEFLFESIDGDETNIHFKNNIPENHITNSFIYEYVYNGGGVAVGDINNDGLDDIYFTSNLHANALYLNQGELEFKDISKSSGTEGKRGWTTGVSLVDINNDGLLDIYLCKSGPYEKAALLENELYINKGLDEDELPYFEEEAKKYGLNSATYSIQAAFLDFDLDGDLDMYLMNHNPQTFAIGNTETFSPLGDKFYENRKGAFFDITAQVGIYSNAVSYGLGAGISDLNMDGWPDIYISNDYDEPDYMYLNQRDGTFREVIKQATNHVSNFSMGNDIADFDNDGYMDILTLDMVSEDNYGMKTSMASMNPEKFMNNVEAGKHYQYMYNTFQKHSTHIDTTGVPFYSDIAQITGVSNTDWSWAPLLADFDNDGLKDIFISNGIKRDFRNKDFFSGMQSYMDSNPDALTNPDKINSLIDKTPHRASINYFYRNIGGLDFENTSKLWMDEPVADYSNGAAYTDLDNDGDLDLVINNVDKEATILRNNSKRTENDFLQLEFTGMPNNSKGIGVKAVVYTDSGQQVFENYSVRGYQSSVPPKMHIGLSKTTSIDSILVHWPGYGKQKISNSPLNKLQTVQFDSTFFLVQSKSLKKSTLFESVYISPEISHKENEFDDYEIQVLLPHKMSQFGPAMAAGDINGDGREDIFLGQGSGEISAMYTQNDKGLFALHQNFEADAIYEDVDATFLDFDKDGDLDLFVSSGGNEFSSGSPNYQDRLYENKGGKFSKRTDLLPVNHISTSKVSIEDYDKNGYPDIFVAGRHDPHNYPAPASSYLLKNVGGKFVDVTEDKASELKNLGLVTDATWTDFDGDGDLDLCVVGEWMSPVFFRNNDNSFDKFSSNKLDSLSGWYYTIKALDIDKDGDEDYLLGNLGENYKYKTSASEPFEVSYADFDGNGKKDLVLGYYNFGELYPVRGRECSAQQMPSIKKITPTYDAFGKSTIAEIYGELNADQVLRLQAFNFRSGVLKNNGNGNFDFIPFPKLVQLSSINAILTKDLDLDGNEDLIVAGNLFGSEIETPRNDAGYGLVLLNNADFQFSPINAHESGLFLPGDVKDLDFINIKGSSHLLAGNNNSPVGLFKIEEFPIQEGPKKK